VGERRAAEPVPRSIRALPLLFVVGAIAVAVYTARIVSAPIETLHLVVPDDAVYYLAIARHLAATGVSTADGVSATNGYHPLWMAVTTLLAAVTADRLTLLRAAMTVSLALHLAAALLVRRVVGRIDGAWGWLAAIGWLLNPLSLLMALQAMECAVYVVVGLWLLLCHVRLADVFADRRPPWRSIAGYGALLGVLALARTEGAMIVPLALAGVFVRTRQRAGWLAAGGAVAVAVAALAVVVAPWLLFSLAQVGTITQDSGAMKALWAADLFPDAGTRLRNVVDTADYFYRRNWRLVLADDVPLRPLTLVPLAIAGVALWTLRRRWRDRAGVTLRAILVPAAVTGLAYGVSLVERQVWWLGLPWLATCLAAAIGLATACATPPLVRRAEIVRALAFGAVVALFANRAASPVVQYRWQPDVLASQRQIEALVPAAQRIGCFNAGIPIYFGAPGRVVALDGLVSHDARRYWYDRAFDAYLTHAGVRFVADEQLALNRAARFAAAPLPLAVVAEFPLRGWPTRVRLLWRVTAPAP
jgi:hypothetical protein